LVLPADFVDAELAVGFHFHAVAQGDFQACRVDLPNHSAQGRARVFEREIQMPRGGARDIGKFAAHPHILKRGIGFDHLSQMRGEAGYSPLNGGEEGRLCHGGEDNTRRGESQSNLRVSFRQSNQRA
jgi:hypothetical protein